MGESCGLTQGAFSGHESFPFRYGWLKRGLDAVAEDGLALGRPDALVTLGVGKNMVSSMRHWLLALRLVEFGEDVARPSRHLVPTLLGRAMFLEPAWDPYLEHDATLWILHHVLATDNTRAGTWWWVFHRPETATFRRDQILTELERLVADNDLKVSRSTLKRDVDCFVRTYLAVARGPVNPEDVYSAPLTALGLIQTTLDRDEYILSRGEQPSLPDEILAWALCHFVARENSERRDRIVGLDQLLFGNCSPGRVFRLTESALIGRLERLPRSFPDIWQYDETAGRHLLIQRRDVSAEFFLESYYDSQAKRSREVA